MSSYSTIDFLATWENLYNPNFNRMEFQTVRSESDRLIMTPKQWIERMSAIGITSHAGRYGGTYAHSDIAFEFASWISPEFKLYIIKDYQRLKKDEAKRLEIGWDTKRELTKINYRIHTDAIKEFLITPELTKQEQSYAYATEADILNIALFGKTAKQWRDETGNKKSNRTKMKNRPLQRQEPAHIDTAQAQRPDTYLLNKDIVPQTSGTCTGVFFIRSFHTFKRRWLIMKQLRCALYPRVSTEEQHIHGLSLPAQVKDLTEYANRMGYHIVDVYADEGVSARKPVSKRPALLRLLGDVEKGLIDIILVTKLDRWFRNIKEYQLTQEILEKHNCYWKTIFEEYDTSTANGQMVVNIMLAVAQNECDRTSERIKVVLQHKVQNGEHVTGAAPYGYITVNKKLAKDPDRAHIVENIFSHYFTTFSKKNTVSYILGKYQDPKLTEYKINRILGSEAYCGRYRGISGYYPAYITEQQFQQIQQASVAKSYRHTDGAYIFSGLLTCPVCGRNLTGMIAKKKLKDGSVSHYRRYRCQAKFDTHPSPCITESVVENYMIEHLQPRLLHCLYRASASKSKAREDKRPQIQGEMERLNKLYQKGRISDQYYEEQYELLEKKLAALPETNAERELASYQRIEKAITGDWLRIYQTLDYEHKNAFWKRIISEITFDKETRKISGFSFLI